MNESRKNPNGGRQLVRTLTRWSARAGPLAWFELVRDNLDAERAQWFLWLPVALGLGIVCYFRLSWEPGLGLALGLPVVAGAAWIALSRHGGGAPLLVTALLAVACGFALAKIRTEAVRAPVLAAKRNLVELKGRIEHVEPSSTRGRRIVVRILSAHGLSTDETPKRARIRLMNEGDRLTAGDVIRLKATLTPPPGPALPGGYDFARTAWYLGVGATGYALHAPTVEQRWEEPWGLGRIFERIERLRQTIGERIAAAVPGEAGAIATSLITGERGGISEETTTAFRDSGLLHILSISGLHMVVMAGAVFVSVRFALAAVPSIALLYPIKTWAAAAALVAAFGYLLLSGSAIATVRAFIMIAIMFTAIMLDRPALAMRNVALSALIILAVTPESLLDAGFQMSFSAVVSLLAAYEFIRERQRGRLERGPLLRLMYFVGGIVLTTVIASIAVAPFGAYHFHRSQQYALLANIVAIPICNIIVMPAGLLTLVAMPFGLEALPLAIMEQGIIAIVWCARSVAALPGAVASIPAIGDTAFGLMVGGGLWLTLWRRRWRVLGLVPIAAGIVCAMETDRPDVLAGLGGSLVAVRGSDGKLAAISQGRGTFELSRWLEHDGDSREPKDAIRKGLFTCDGLGCIATTPHRLTLAVSYKGAAFADDCRAAAILIATLPAPADCTQPALKLDYFGFRKDGGYAIYFDRRRSGRDGVGVARVETITAARGDRPWSQSRERRAWRPPLPHHEGGGKLRSANWERARDQ